MDKLESINEVLSCPRCLVVLLPLKCQDVSLQQATTASSHTPPDSSFFMCVIS
jgi:hypothetical protein